MIPSFQDRFYKFTVKQKLFKAGDRVLAAVSGGLDSMVLMHLLHKAGVLAGVAHVNYRLRGEDSELDQGFVEEISKSFGIPFFVKVLPSDWKNNLSGSLQMEAREIRYDWFEQLKANYNFNSIATAHHLDDQAETVILQITKGLNFTGFFGIQVRSGNVIRPLLFSDRNDLLTFAKDSGIAWREDQSNKSNDYQRNLIRNKVLPVLKEINPSVTDSLEIGKFKSLGIYELFQQKLNEIKNELVVENFNGTWSILRERIASFKNPSSVLYHLIENFGFHYSICDQVINPNIQSGKAFYSDEFILLVDRKYFFISKRSTRSNHGFQLISGYGKIEMGNQELHLFECDCGKPKKSLSNEIIIDLDKINFPLIWRFWQPGDAFIPLGMRSHKKISDLLIDEKYSILQKDQVTVLVSGDKIVWVVGVRLSEEFKITPDSSRAVCIRYKGA